MNKKIFLFSILIFIAMAGFAQAYDYYYGYYPDYYSYGYSDYGYYPYDYGYYDYYDYSYYTYPYDSFYYEEVVYDYPATYYPPSQPQAVYCQNPYGTEGQKKCFDLALHVCKSGDWLFDRNVQCCQASECQPQQVGDYCRFGKSCSSYQCTSGSQQFCPLPGTNKDGICYYGNRDCTASGCVINKCVLQANQRCDADEGCVSIPCDESACDSRDGWYCRGGDVTREFRDYYCSQSSGQTCSYSITDSETRTDEWVCDGDYSQRVHWSCSNGEFFSTTSGRTFCQYGCENGRCRTQTCNVDECNSRDGFYGDRFCRYGDVYRQYRNYYCSGSSCAYSTEDRKIEDCYDGCSGGYCTSQQDCDNLDGFYGSRFCRYGDAYQQYRNYYRTDSTCSYTTEDRLRETCDVDSELGARFCKDGDVYVRYRDSFCSNGYCDSNIYDKKVQDCNVACRTEGADCTGGCENGYCTGAAPVVCESRCDAWSDWYRINGDMERTQVCYSYIKSGSSCVLSKTYTVVQRSPAGVVTPSLEKEKAFEFGFNISYKREDVQLQHEALRLYNGLLFGSNEIKFSLKAGTHVGKLSLSVDAKNGYGDLLVYLGSDLIYEKNPDIGAVEINIDKNLDKDTALIIKASSSWWRLWAPATFDVSNVALSITSDVIKKDSFEFELYQDEYDGFTGGKITITPTDGFDIFINSRKVSGDKINKADLKVGANILEFIPRPGRSYSGKAVVSVFYRN